MGFYIGNEDLKTYIKLSYYAISVIEGDMSALANGNARNSKGPFLNELMENYGFEQECNELKKFTEQIKLYEKEATDHFSIKLRMEIRKKLENTDSEIVDFFGNSIGDYIKTIAEYYARLSYYERERIWYKDKIFELEDSFGRFCLKISTTRINQNDSPHIVLPYKIEHDKWTGYNYLTGIEYSDENTKKPCCFRVAFISDVKRLSPEKYPSKITKDDIKQIEKEKEKKGVQFLPGNTEKIKILLTDNGQKMYNQIIYMRPQFTEKENNNIYCFDCTPLQIEYYFLKFGKDAEVLEPLALRKRFYEFYESATTIYSRST
jgi:hypothetical protein